MTSMTRWPDRSPVIARSEATKQSSFAEPTLAKRKSASAREQKAGLLRCARNDGAVLTTASNPVIARSEATKQSSFAEPTLATRKSASACEQKAGLLRCARNDGARTGSAPTVAIRL